ncbi:MAG: phosphorylase family protein [Solirubrobacterales bacterium]
MPARLRPTAPIAADAVLVGDPGRALMLAQELLEQPKMSNHARGLWGYSGVTPAGDELTIQATGMGGPSAAVVVADLAELGVKRAIRIGTCASLGELGLGEPLVVTEAHTPGGGRSLPDRALTAQLEESIEGATRGIVVSLDSLHRPEAELPSMVAEGADMQTAGLLRAAEEHGVAAAAVLIAAEKSDSGQLRDEDLEAAAKRAGRAASALLST